MNNLRVRFTGTNRRAPSDPYAPSLETMDIDLGGHFRVALATSYYAPWRDHNETVDQRNSRIRYAVAEAARYFERQLIVTLNEMGHSV